MKFLIFIILIIVAISYFFGTGIHNTTSIASKLYDHDQQMQSQSSSNQ